MQKITSQGNRLGRGNQMTSYDITGGESKKTNTIFPLSEGFSGV